MQTARRAHGRGDPVEGDQYTALSGSGESDAREVLVEAADITGFRDKFRTHSASLHEPFTCFAEECQRSRN